MKGTAKEIETKIKTAMQIQINELRNIIFALNILLDFIYFVRMSITVFTALSVASISIGKVFCGIGAASL